MNRFRAATYLQGSPILGISSLGRVQSLRYAPSLREYSSSPPTDPRPERPNFYRTHGRAVFKALTLAFLTYQIAYWSWLTIETEELKDYKNREIQSLEQEVRLLEEGRKGHRPNTG